MRGGGVRHPERAQRNIRLVFAWVARGSGGYPQINNWTKWISKSSFQIFKHRQATAIRAGEHLQPAQKCSRWYYSKTLQLFPDILRITVTLLVQDASGLRWFFLWLTSPLCGYQRRVIPSFLRLYRLGLPLSCESPVSIATWFALLGSGWKNTPTKPRFGSAKSISPRPLKSQPIKLTPLRGATKSTPLKLKSLITSSSADKPTTQSPQGVGLSLRLPDLCASTTLRARVPLTKGISLWERFPLVAATP